MGATLDLIEKQWYPAWDAGDRDRFVQVTREMEDAAYALYGVAPVAALPAEAYVVRVRAVVIRSV